MSRAEQAALKAIPNVAGPYDVMSSADKRRVFIEGYNQAFSDAFGLVRELHDIYGAMFDELLESTEEPDWHLTDEAMFTEVLRRFNELKAEKK